MADASKDDVFTAQVNFSRDSNVLSPGRLSNRSLELANRVNPVFFGLGEVLETRRLRDQMFAAIVSDVLLCLEHTVEMERHPLLTQHVVQPLALCATVLDFQYEAELPRCRNTQLVGLCYVSISILGLSEAPQNNRRIQLSELAYFLGVDILDGQSLGS